MAVVVDILVVDMGNPVVGMGNRVADILDIPVENQVVAVDTRVVAAVGILEVFAVDILVVAVVGIRKAAAGSFCLKIYIFGRLNCNSKSS